MQDKKNMSLDSVSHIKTKTSYKGISEICQQMEFMFKEMMSRFEKLKTRVESGLSKESIEVRKKFKKG
jgi:DNA polymerase II small subunit/DNA polymerase delta subunit B